MTNFNGHPPYESETGISPSVISSDASHVLPFSKAFESFLSHAELFDDHCLGRLTASHIEEGNISRRLMAY